MNAFLVRASAIVLLGLATATASAGTVNKSIRIEAGTTADGASSVNGSVTVGDAATVTGDVSTVNGSIKVGDSASVSEVSTVNGSIRIGNGVQTQDIETVNGTIRAEGDVRVDGGVEAVNGKIEFGMNSQISRDIENVNGQISLDGTTLGGGISTVNGDITLDNGTRVGGDIVIEKPGGWFTKKKKRVPRITLGRDVVVEGEIITEREIEIYMHDSATVGGISGEASMNDVVRFSGNRP